MSTIHSPSASRLITSNFSSVPTVYCWLFTWIALGDVYLCFSFHFGNESQCCWRGNYIRHDCITNIINSYVTDGAQWYHFLLASNTRQQWPGTVYAKLPKTEDYRVSCKPITVNCKLSRNFKQWCTFSSAVTAKLHKKIM